jgi:hypothetical protein
MGALKKVTRRFCLFLIHALLSRKPRTNLLWVKGSSTIENIRRDGIHDIFLFVWNLASYLAQSLHHPRACCRFFLSCLMSCSRSLLPPLLIQRWSCSTITRCFTKDGSPRDFWNVRKPNRLKQLFTNSRMNLFLSQITN